MNKYTIALLLALVIFVSGCAGYSAPAEEAGHDDEGTEPHGHDGEAEHGNSGEELTAEVPVTGSEGVDEMIVGETTTSQKTVTIDIIAKNWEFEPSTITVKKDTAVTIRLTGSDDGSGNGHALSIAEFDVRSDTLKTGETVEVTFTPDKVGEFQFRCSVFCGVGHGTMTGTLVVTE